jgi:hypothetical protein
MWRSHKHDDMLGPFASGQRNTQEVKSDVEGPSSSEIKLGNRFSRDKMDSRLGNRTSGVMSPEPYEGT